MTKDKSILRLSDKENLISFYFFNSFDFWFNLIINVDFNLELLYIWNSQLITSLHFTFPVLVEVMDLAL